MKEAIKILESERKKLYDAVKKEKCDISELESMLLQFSNKSNKDHLTKSVIYLTEEQINKHKNNLEKYNNKLEDIKNAIKLIKDNVS